MLPSPVVGLAVSDAEVGPSAISPFTSLFFFPALLALASVVALCGALVALAQIGAADWMHREQQVLWRVVVVCLPVGGAALWAWTRGRTPAERAADERGRA